MNTLTKKLLVIFTMLALVYSCQNVDENLEELEVASEADVAPSEIANASMASGKAEELPTILFRAKGKDENKTVVVIKDPFLATVPNQKIQVDYFFTLDFVGGISVASGNVDGVGDDIFPGAVPTIRVTLDAAFSEKFKERIIPITLKYSNEKGEVIKAYEYDAFVFEDGKTALQKPTIGGTLFRLLEGETPSLELEVQLNDDPAGLVENVSVELTDGGFYKGLIKRRTKGGFVVDIDGIEAFLKPGTYTTVAIHLLNGMMEQVGASFKGETFVQKADFTGRVRRIRIREQSGGTSFRTIVVVDGDTNQEVAAVELKYEALNGNPSAIPATSIATFQKTTEKGLDRFVYKPLTFEGGAMPYGEIYNVTATLLQADGTPLSEPITRDVVVETYEPGDEDPNVKLVGTRLFSFDGGKSWEFQARMQSDSAEIVRVVTEFTGPFEGPEPVQTKLVMEQTGEEPGGIVVYSTPVQFKGDPQTSFVYDATVNVTYRYGGFGTKRTASQANTKTELL